MRLSEDIRPISYLRNNADKAIERVNTSGPMVITRNGVAAAVLMGVKDYERLTEAIALFRILSMGEKSIREGRGSPAAEAFRRIRARIKESRARN